MNIPSDDGVNVWQQCRTSVGHVTLAALSTYALGEFEIARGVFNGMVGPPDRRDRDVTWIGQGVIFYVAFSAPLAAGGAILGWGSQWPFPGYNYVFDAQAMAAGNVAGWLQSFAKSPILAPYVVNLTAGPVTFAYCFRILPMLPVTA